jgi:hypothetical protein
MPASPFTLAGAAGPYLGTTGKIDDCRAHPLDRVRPTGAARCAAGWNRPRPPYVMAARCA